MRVAECKDLASHLMAVANELPNLDLRIKFRNLLCRKFYTEFVSFLLTNLCLVLTAGPPILTNLRGRKCNNCDYNFLLCLSGAES